MRPVLHPSYPLVPQTEFACFLLTRNLLLGKEQLSGLTLFPTSSTPRPHLLTPSALALVSGIMELVVDLARVEHSGRSPAPSYSSLLPPRLVIPTTYPRKPYQLPPLWSEANIQPLLRFVTTMWQVTNCCLSLSENTVLHRVGPKPKSSCHVQIVDGCRQPFHQTAAATQERWSLVIQTFRRASPASAHRSDAWKLG